MRFLRPGARAGWLAPLLVVAWSFGCGSDPSPTAPPASIESVSSGAGGAAAPPVASSGVTASADRPQADVPPVVLIKTSLGDIQVRLSAEKAPITVDNFLRNYVDRGFYDQTTFHYVDRGFMIAGGGYTADLEPKETRTEIRSEASNGLKNRRGAVGMIRHAQYVHSATSQFFINLADNPSLDYKSSDDDSTYGYCVFGEVIEGMDVVDRIAQVEVRDRGDFPKCPVEPIIIETIQRIVSIPAP